MVYKLSPFVKWAGGKTQLLHDLGLRMPKTFNKYYEPFIGGGALLFNMHPAHAVISDVNEQLINVYRQLKDNAEAVISEVKELDAVPCDKERYLAVREDYNAKIQANELDPRCAALMIWVNKHCFNGLYRVNGKGFFNVPYNNRVKGSSIDEENLRNISAYLRDNNVDIRLMDFAEALHDVSAGDFVYLDSPYVPVSDTASFTDYTRDGFTLEDHRRLAGVFRELTEMGVKAMLSNHNVPLVHELYKDFIIDESEVKRFINSNGSKRMGEEVIITNFYPE